MYFRDGEFAFDMTERKADTIVDFMKEYVLYLNCSKYKPLYFSRLV